MKKSRKKEKKLLINGLSAVWGGGVVYLKHLLSDFPFSVVFVANAQNRRDFEDLPECSSNLEIIWIDAPSFLHKLKFYFFQLPRLCRKLAITHLYEPANIIYSKPAGVKTVLNIQNLAPFFFHPQMKKQKLKWKMRWAILRFLSAMSLKRADRVVFISKYGRELVANLYPEHSARFATSIVYHGAPENENPDNDSHTRYLLDKKINRDYLFAPAHLLWYKNIETLLYAMRDIIKEMPDLTLVIAGNFTTPDYGIYLKKIIKKLSIEKNICFTGELDRVLLGDFYRNCRLVLFSSLIENMPFTLLESMNYGCPIVAGRCASIPEVLGDAGILVKPQSSYEFARAVLHLLSNPDLEQSLRKRSEKRAKQFTWAKCASLMKDIFRTL